jgi:DNA-binding CsgD family transcriptional regulator
MQKPASALTRREIEVLALSARGNNAAQAAKELGITKRTVDEHRQSIFRKLGTSNITHAVAVALTFGIIDVP